MSMPPDDAQRLFAEKRDLLRRWDMQRREKNAPGEPEISDAEVLRALEDLREVAKDASVDDAEAIHRLFALTKTRLGLKSE